MTSFNFLNTSTKLLHFQLFLLLALFSSAFAGAQAAEETLDVLASIQKNHNFEKFERAAIKFGDDRQALNNELLKVFNNVAASNMNRCWAAYYLGELRQPDSVNSLASNITLLLIRHPLIHLPLGGMCPARDALIKIGSPAVGALLDNLQKSDDPNVREYSLNALYQIENDMDVVKLRLQKVMDARQDQQTRARIHEVLKLLDDPHFRGWTGIK